MPGQEALCDLGGIQVTRGGHLGDADGHLGVVGPLPRLPAEVAAADHVDVVGGMRVELVPGAEGVAGGEADQGADGPVSLSWSQRCRPFDASRSWRTCCHGAGGAWPIRVRR